MAWFRCTGGSGGSLKLRTASGAIASFETNLAARLNSLKANIMASGGGGTPSTPIPLVPFTELNVINVSDTDLASALKNVYEGKWGFVDLGSLNYVYSDSGFTTQLPNNAKELNSNAEVLNCICDMYEVMSWNDATYNKQSGTMGTGISRYIVLYNSAYSDAVAFKTAMSGKYLLYELATETTPSITETDFNNIVSSFNANGDLITIDLNGTRYGGYVDANNGKLVVTHEIYDLGDVNWYREQAGGYYRFRASGYAPIPSSKTSGGVDESILCSCFIESPLPSSYNTLDNAICIYNGMPIVRCDAYTDAATFKTAMVGQKVTFTLATPIEVDITPAFLSAIANQQNNVFHDGNGDSEVKYLYKEASE